LSEPSTQMVGTGETMIEADAKSRSKGDLAVNV
jgi:hypothetical protein